MAKNGTLPWNEYSTRQVLPPEASAGRCGQQPSPSEPKWVWLLPGPRPPSCPGRARALALCPLVLMPPGSQEILHGPSVDSKVTSVFEPPGFLRQYYKLETRDYGWHQARHCHSFIFLHTVVFKPRMSILPLLLLCLFKNGRHIGATCYIHPSPLPKFRWARAESRLGAVFPLDMEGGTLGQGLMASWQPQALQWFSKWPSDQHCIRNLIGTEITGPHLTESEVGARPSHLFW